MFDAKSLTKLFTLLSDISVFNTYTFEEFLKKLIRLITNIIPVDSCFIYFYDREKKELILVASKKTHTKLLGKITLKNGEGITGWAAQHKKTVVLKKHAYKDDRFKSFKEIPEDTFEAFMSVPVIDRNGVAGVVNLQHKTQYAFTKDQIIMVEAIVKMIASAFETVALSRKVGNLTDRLEERKVIERAKGILMKHKKMNENEAFLLLRKDAMKHRKSMREIAEAVILIWG